MINMNKCLSVVDKHTESPISNANGEECPMRALWSVLFYIARHFSLTTSRIQVPTIDSNTFESVQVKDIGVNILIRFSSLD